MALARKSDSISNFGPSWGGTRKKSGKLLRQALYQTVYAWRPFEPDFTSKAQKAALKTIKNCCETCEGKTVDNCVTYVWGGQCEPTVVPAYVRCEYVD
tara:strand:+ start:847 stop:1140 length:294 start_codon:yes stop_codon:yes gene_type:complete